MPSAHSPAISQAYSQDNGHPDIDDLDRAIVNLAARINAASYELLVLVRRFDERGGWLKWGFSNCSEWLHWRCDLSLSAARERVRVAHSLKTLPAIAAAFSCGELSYSKARSLTRVDLPLQKITWIAGISSVRTGKQYRAMDISYRT